MAIITTPQQFERFGTWMVVAELDFTFYLVQRLKFNTVTDLTPGIWSPRPSEKIEILVVKTFSLHRYERADKCVQPWLGRVEVVESTETLKWFTELRIPPYRRRKFVVFCLSVLDDREISSRHQRYGRSRAAQSGIARVNAVTYPTVSAINHCVLYRDIAHLRLRMRLSLVSWSLVYFLLKCGRCSTTGLPRKPKQTTATCGLVDTEYTGNVHPGIDKVPVLARWCFRTDTAENLSTNIEMAMCRLKPMCQGTTRIREEKTFPGNTKSLRDLEYKLAIHSGVGAERKENRIYLTSLFVYVNSWSFRRTVTKAVCTNIDDI
ncbi:hypothetical protein J6590_005416 [Homalodisca vitripennis]|nr:hypothetical protein J6590_005416 [Homalodisca vitripennis]